jgi:hypothetical protein
VPETHRSYPKLHDLVLPRQPHKVCDRARDARRERRRRAVIGRLVSMMCGIWCVWRLFLWDSQLGEHAVGGGAEAASDGYRDPLLRQSHGCLYT